MRPTLAIWSGVAIAASKSRKPPWIFSIRSSLPTMSAPAACACSALSPTANTATRAVLPVPCGRLTVPRTIWSALRGSTPSRIATSTVASCLVDDVSLASLAASSGVYRLLRSTFSAAARYALLFLLIRFIQSDVGSWLAAGRSWPSHGCDRYSTVMPIDRAVPAMILAAASMSLALRSAFLVSAISRT